MNLNRKTRHELISWQQHQIFMPRLQMSLILLLTGFTGFLSSFLLLQCGLTRMWVRYPLGILSAYIVFLLLLRLWLALHRSQGIFDLGTNFDLPVDGLYGGAPSPGPDLNFSSGGDFGGGGAGGSWGNSISSASPSNSGGGSSSLLDGAGSGLDLEEIGFLILAVVALLGGLIATLYVVYIAPALLAEILVDGLLLGGLYHRVGRMERKHWLQTAVCKTLLPALLCTLFFGVAGGAFQAAAPNAKSVGEVWSVLTKDQPVNQ